MGPLRPDENAQNQYAEIDRLQADTLPLNTEEQSQLDDPDETYISLKTLENGLNL